MINQQGVALTFYAFYTDTDGVGVTGLTVTVDVYEGVTGTPIVSAGSATALGGGIYYYTLSSGSVDANGAYIALFKTAGTVAQKHLPALQSVGNIINAAVQSIASNAVNATALATDAVTEIQSGLSTLDAAGVRTAVGLGSANLDTQLDALPTNAELATALGTADDATLTAIGALSIPSAASIRSEMDSNSTQLAAIVADTNELQTDWANGGRLDLLIDTIVTNVAAILADTGTDGVVLSTATQQAIADVLLGRSAANVESSAGVYTIAGLIFAAFESAVSGVTWTINRSDGTTQFATRTVATDVAAEPIVSVQ